MISITGQVHRCIMKLPNLFKKLYDKKEFSEQESEQYFDEKAGQFLADRYIKGNCPKCNFDGAYGDQCENCGTSLSPNELIHPKSMLSGETPFLKNKTLVSASGQIRRLVAGVDRNRISES